MSGCQVTEKSRYNFNECKMILREEIMVSGEGEEEQTAHVRDAIKI